MNWEPEIIEIEPKKVIGIKHIMSMAQDRTLALWQTFGPRRKEINALYKNSVSIKIYNKGFFDHFEPKRAFEKWAAVEVNNFDTIPDGMKTMEIPAGKYAVFHYQGLNTDHSIYEYIYGEWLQKSGYKLDDRPHFEIMAINYMINDPLSEEDIFIPLK